MARRSKATLDLGKCDCGYRMIVDLDAAKEAGGFRCPGCGYLYQLTPTDDRKEAAP